VMGELYEPEQISQLTLEEVELSSDGSSWRVTLSFVRPARKSAIEAMTGQQGTPIYKVLEIHGETAEVQSMKNRVM
jgi:hypothetical protein